LNSRTGSDLLAPQLPAISPSKPRLLPSAGAFHWRLARCSTAKRSPAQGGRRGGTVVCPVWRICAGCRPPATTVARSRRFTRGSHTEPRSAQRDVDFGRAIRLAKGNGPGASKQPAIPTGEETQYVEVMLGTPFRSLRMASGVDFAIRFDCRMASAGDSGERKYFTQLPQCAGRVWLSLSVVPPHHDLAPATNPVGRGFSVAISAARCGGK
jgi:hypothetical protein